MNDKHVKPLRIYTYFTIDASVGTGASEGQVSTEASVSLPDQRYPRDCNLLASSLIHG